MAPYRLIVFRNNAHNFSTRREQARGDSPKSCSKFLISSPPGLSRETNESFFVVIKKTVVQNIVGTVNYRLIFMVENKYNIKSVFAKSIKLNDNINYKVIY